MENENFTDKRPFLSVIIPAHNAEATIERLLQSVGAQNFNDKMEVILVNDACTDKTINKALACSVSMHIPLKIINSPFSVHCAGNSREAGMQCATGEWITFIDHDDEFEPDVFNEVYEKIISEHQQYYFCTFHSEFHDDEQTKLPMTPELGVPLESWLHGKFFHLDNLIKGLDLHFARDLFYLEDIYFTKKMLEKMFLAGLIKFPRFTYHDIHTYIWHVSGQNTHTKLTMGKYVHNDYGVATVYSDIVFPFYEKVLTCPTASQEAKEDSMYGLIASLKYIFYTKQKLIGTYGRNDPIVKVLQQNIDNNISCLFLSDIPDSDILATLCAKMSNDLMGDPVVIYEDVTVWYGQMKGRVMDHWYQTGMLADRDPRKNGVIEFYSYFLPIDMKDPMPVPVRNVNPPVAVHYEPRPFDAQTPTPVGDAQTPTPVGDVQTLTAVEDAQILTNTEVTNAEN